MGGGGGVSKGLFLLGGCLQVLKALGGVSLAIPPPHSFWGVSFFHLQYKRIGAILGIVIHL